jgi:hypothetical protein
MGLHGYKYFAPTPLAEDGGREAAILAGNPKGDLGKRSVAAFGKKPHYSSISKFAAPCRVGATAVGGFCRKFQTAKNIYTIFPVAVSIQ